MGLTTSLGGYVWSQHLAIVYRESTSLLVCIGAHHQTLTTFKNLMKYGNGKTGKVTDPEKEGGIVAVY